MLQGNNIISIYASLPIFFNVISIRCRYLQNKYSFIDEKKTAIWGWSYGGYAAGMSLALDEYNVFKCGISVAPVSSWHLYGTKYFHFFQSYYTNSEFFA